MNKWWASQQLNPNPQQATTQAQQQQQNQIANQGTQSTWTYYQTGYPTLVGPIIGSGGAGGLLTTNGTFGYWNTYIVPSPINLIHSNNGTYMFYNIPDSDNKALLGIFYE